MFTYESMEQLCPGSNKKQVAWRDLINFFTYFEFFFLPFMWRTRLGWGLCRVKNEFWLSWPNLYPPVEPWVEGLLRKVSKDAIYPSSTGPGRAKRSPLAGRNTSDWLILQKENKNIRIINGYKINFILFSNSKFGTRCLIPLIWDLIFFLRFSCSLEHGILIWTFKNDLWYVWFIYLRGFFLGGGL